MCWKSFCLALLISACPLAYAQNDRVESVRKLLEYNQKLPLEIKEVSSSVNDGVTIHDITYASPKGGRVTAYLVVPTGKGPHAGMVFGHWGPGNRTEFLPEATLYARAGAVCVLVDYPWVRPVPWRKPLKQEDDPEGDHALFVQAVVDLRRGLDLLAERADVDPKRLGYVGHSFGAQWGAILSAAEPRLKVVVLMAGVPDQAAIWRDNDDPGVVAWRTNTPKEKQEAYLKVTERTAAVRYVPQAGCPLLMQFARHERYFDQAAMDRYAAAAAKDTLV